MDRLVEQQGSSGPWPNVDVDVAGLSRALGCPARTIAEHDDLLATLDEVLPALVERREPLLVEVKVAPDKSFSP
jgi:benzoylformate decarboxylase